MLIFFISTKAQIIELFEKKTYSKGYIITVKKDTINGFIVDTDEYNGKVKYKINQDDKSPQKINASEIDQMKVSYNFFDKVNCKNKSYLMKRIIKGEISFYKYTFTRTMPTGPMGPMGGSYMSTSESESYYLIKGVNTIKIKKRKLHKVLKELMVDFPEIYPEIDKLDTDIDLDMIEYYLRNLVNEYNYMIKVNKNKL
ncbi:MAG: hypothetical protein AB7S50_03560 [Bacteroidales bacterium]